MLGYFCSVPLPTPLRANPARNGEPGCAGLGCRRSSFSRLPRISFVGGTAGPSTPPEAGCARDDSSRENAGSARNDNSGENAGRGAEAPLYPAANRGPSTPPETGSARDDRSKENAGSAWGDNRMGRAGLQASVQAASQVPSTLPKASAQSARTERHRGTAGPSARAEALGRDDKFLGGRGTRA